MTGHAELSPARRRGEFGGILPGSFGELEQSGNFERLSAPTSLGLWGTVRVKKPKLTEVLETPFGASSASVAAADSIRSNGSVSIRAAGSSMIPSIWPGEILLVRRVAIAEVCPGEVVLAERGGKLFAHRVVEVRGEGSGARIVTQGDALAASDPEISEAELLGRVAAIARGGEWREPKTHLGMGARILRAIVRRSSFAARVLLHLHAQRERAVAPRPATQASATWGS